MKPQKEAFDLSIVIVSYNTRELLRACLSSLGDYHQMGDRIEVIVVDNASTDGSTEAISNIQYPISNFKIIRNTKNFGFAAANNQGIRVSKGRYVLLLNSDTEVTLGVLRELINYMDSQRQVGALTCLVKLADGSIDPACHRGFPTPWASFTYFLGFERIFGRSLLFGQYHQGYKPMHDIHSVDCISGAFFFIRREVIDRVGFLDEEFFMYGEDIDWCYRIREAGWKIRYYPHVSILHKKYQSGLEHANDQTRQITRGHFYDAMRLFYDKHYRHRYGWCISFFVLLGIKVCSYF